MSTKRKILIAILLVMTLALASLSAYIAFQANKGTGDDVGVGNISCGTISCRMPDGSIQNFGSDCNAPHGSCDLRATEACKVSEGGQVLEQGAVPSECTSGNGNNGGNNQNKKIGDACVFGGNPNPPDGCDGDGALACIRCPASTFYSGQGRCALQSDSSIYSACGGNADGQGVSQCDDSNLHCSNNSQDCGETAVDCGSVCGNTCSSPGGESISGLTIGDDCSDFSVGAICGQSGEKQLNCIQCGEAYSNRKVCGYGTQVGGNEVSIRAACSSPGLNTVGPKVCEGTYSAYQVKCESSGLGRVCQPDGSFGALVVADACGANCYWALSNQIYYDDDYNPDTNSNKPFCACTASDTAACKSECAPNQRLCKASLSIESRFIGCGDHDLSTTYSGFNGDSCSNCYKNLIDNNSVTCFREGTSCGAKPECVTTGGGNPSGGGGTNPPPPTGNVRLAGRVYCQDPGGPLLPVQGATVNIFNGTTNSTVTATTDANGRYQRDVSASGQQWFAARLQNVGTGNLSNGQPKSSMTFRDSFCENNSQTGCENSNVACGGAPYYSYEACLTNANETYGNFDFVFQNCTPQFCGDRTCQTGEYCEYAADGQTFVACAGNPAGLPVGTVVNNCRDLSPTAPGNSVPPACTFCGDGVVNGGEQCDPNATGTGGENCNAQCQTVTPVCESLNGSVSEDINIGEGNTITYTLRYINAAETNPFPNIALVVEDSRGRDFYKPEQTYVQPAEIDNNPSFIPSTSTWVYTFVWEAADTTGTVVTPLTNGGPFDVQILTDYNDTNSVIGNSSCTEQLTLSATTDQPNFVITKTGAEVCTENNDARINYTIRVENISQVEGIIDQVTDTIDQDLVQANLSPTAISPNFGTYSNGVITWIGTEDQRTFDAGEAKTYTYQISIPNSIIERFYSTGIDNRAELEFDENTLEFEVNTEIDCQKIIIPINIPVTAFEDWDPNTLVIMGMLFTLTGAMLYQTGYGEKLFMGGVNIVKDNTRKRKFEKGILEKIRK